ncbi:extracellular solute-binding protein [Propioniciclava sp.]|uniref:ABC transporter substrate-binding protein n=1 Tax=Propioniciclava sp. TaxID=2038686 RepID=UPI00260DEFAF|nr:extracellular solute-binding protein [Propioniciclava sp.]
MNGHLSRRTLLSGLTAAALLAPLAACSRPGTDAGSTEFFQFKSEAISLFNEICATYNAQHGTNIVQNFQADNVTALRVRLVKGSIPPLITINGDYNYGSLARSGVFHDFAPSGLLDPVNPSIAQILPTLGVGAEGEVNGLPFANNGSGMIYNREIFDQYNLEPPRTWDDLIAIADELSGQGVDPFYWGFRDNWTGAPMFSSISGNFLDGQVAAWYERRRVQETSFEELMPVLDKMHQIAQYGNSNKYEIGYNDGNQGFAQGRAAMYVHGTYAIPAIRSYNPDIQIGTFATPPDSGEAWVVSGVDVALTCGTQPVDGAIDFFSYLMEEQNMAAYCDQQVAFPTREGMTNDDPALEGLMPYFTGQRLTTYSDHNFPQGVNLNNYMQQFLINGDAAAFVRTLDTQYDRVIGRINSTM